MQLTLIFRLLLDIKFSEAESLPEWSKGSDCRSDGQKPT